MDQRESTEKVNESWIAKIMSVLHGRIPPPPHLLTCTWTFMERHWEVRDDTQETQWGLANNLIANRSWTCPRCWICIESVTGIISPNMCNGCYQAHFTTRTQGLWSRLAPDLCREQSSNPNSCFSSLYSESGTLGFKPWGCHELCDFRLTRLGLSFLTCKWG